MQQALVALPHVEPGEEEDRPLAGLVLDDEAVDRMRLEHLCRKAGIRISLGQAGNLGELREKLDSAPFDIVFLDYHLGIENGLDALRILTSHEDQMQAIPIMVTSVNTPDVIVKAMRSGCADYLIKEELSPDSVRATITNAIERRVLLAAISHERASRQLTAATIERFARSCAPEMRRILTSMLRRLRGLRGNGVSENAADQFEALSCSCNELLDFLDTIHIRLGRGSTTALLQAVGGTPD